MAMTINLTLVVQMIHFLIAYYFISKVLLRPAYDAIKSDDNKARQLHALIEAEQERLAEKNEYKKRRWQMCQNYFFKNKPSLETEGIVVPSAKMIEPPVELTPEETRIEAKNIAENLKSKVVQ